MAKQTAVPALTEVEKALLGAIEMLQKIQSGGNYSMIEYVSRLHRYKQILAEARPDLRDDAYFGKLFD